MIEEYDRRESALKRLDMKNYVGPIGMWVLVELVFVFGRPLLIIFERSWLLVKVPDERKKADVTTVFRKDKKEDLANYRLINLDLIPGNPWQIIIKTISECMKDKKVIGNGQYGFLKRKFCLTNMVAFYDEVIVSLDEWTRVDIVCIDLSKASGTSKAFKKSS